VNQQQYLNNLTFNRAVAINAFGAGAFSHVAHLLDLEIRAMPLYINTYLDDRAYGGPEEGGWYFNTSELVDSVPLPAGGSYPHWRAECKMREVEMNEGRPSISSVSSMGQYRIAIESHHGKNYPKERPHYE